MTVQRANLRTRAARPLRIRVVTVALVVLVSGGLAACGDPDDGDDGGGGYVTGQATG
jgi:hypothetical protein